MTCHPKLITLARTVIQAVDFGISCGWRGPEAQDAAYPRFTKLRWPLSKHNHTTLQGAPCSLALDFIPYDNATREYADWDDVELWGYAAGHFCMAAELLGIPIRWGHDWNRNDSLADEAGLVDRPHIELYLPQGEA